MSTGRLIAHRDEHFGGDRKLPLHPDTRDNASFALKARVVDDAYDWGNDRAPRTSLASTVIHEVHIKGFSRLNSHIPPALRGTYAGLSHDASIEHLKLLGITAVSLLPVHLCLDEERLHKLGLHNYWGYNTLGFFCANPGLASVGQGQTARDEFRAIHEKYQPEMHAIQEKQTDLINGFLNETQKQEYLKMRKEREEKMKQSRSRAPGC